MIQVIRDFRDIVAASQRVLNRLGIKRGDTVIDFGSGAGTFAIEAAKRGQECMPLMFRYMLSRAESRLSR